MSHHIISSSGSDRSTGQGGERQLRKTAQAAREEEKEGVREGEQGVRDGEAGGWNEAELDYEEDIEEDGRQIRRNSEEDEVKVHSMEVIEEGELSSGEEGEIKGGRGTLNEVLHVHLSLQMKVSHHQSTPSTHHTPHHSTIHKPHPLVTMVTVSLRRRRRRVRERVTVTLKMMNRKRRKRVTERRLLVVVVAARWAV